MFPVKSRLEDGDQRDLDHRDCGEAVGGGCTRSGHVSRARGHDTMPGPADDCIRGRSAGGRSNGGRGGVGNNQNRFLYSSCAPNPTRAVSDRKSIIAEALVSALARLYKNIGTHFCLNPSKTLSVAEKSVQSRLSLSPTFARREGQNIFSKEIGRCDLIHAIVGIIRSRIKEGVSASTMKQQGKYAKYDILLVSGLLNILATSQGMRDPIVAILYLMSSPAIRTRM